jgi:hypothetical protein
MPAQFIVRLLVSFAFVTAAYAQATDPEATFQRAIALLDSQKYAEAVPLLKEMYVAHPTSQAVLWNFGVAAAEIGDDALALEAWSKYRANFPQDGRALAKLVQTYQSLGRPVDRDRERAKLFSFRGSLTQNEVDAFSQYCREQFRVNGVKIMAFEIFEPKGPKRLYYRFSVLDSLGRETSLFSLGSYDSTTQIARELREIAADARAYHLDRYARGSHSTYGHFNSLPSYEVVRQLVVDALSETIRPTSQSKHDQK